jgi:DNA repair exonuclease SbcCD ATPase subunit
LQKELEQRIKSLESELKQSKDEAAQLRSEKSSSAINATDFSEKVKELEEKYVILMLVIPALSRTLLRVKEKDVLLEKLQSEKSQHSSAVEQLKEELAAQRLKNDVSIEFFLKLFSMLGSNLSLFFCGHPGIADEKLESHGSSFVC